MGRNPQNSERIRLGPEDTKTKKHELAVVNNAETESNGTEQK
jgi:hypothetical protein